MTPAELAERRKALGLTQLELGARLGVTDQAISNWEVGRRTPPAWLDLALRAIEAENQQPPR